MRWEKRYIQYKPQKYNQDQLFAEDLPNSDEKPFIKHQQPSPTVNTYNMHFTVSGAASNHDLFAPNR